MIPLIFRNANVFVWNSEDWKKLREDHRIIGNLLGCLPKAPFQNNFNGLPSVLLKEEVTLLLEKGLAKLVTYKSLVPSDETKSKFTELKTNCKSEQVDFVISEKKKSILSLIDRIVDGKRKKINVRKTADHSASDLKGETELDKEAVLRVELERVEQTPLSHTLVQTFCEDPWLQETDFEDVNNWNYPSTEKESLKYKVFKDLWEKGYYITCGEKFGGDYLVYPGDPVLYHAHYIVLCKDHKELIPWLDIASHCRVGSSSRKTFVIASSSNDESLSYTSFQFETMIRCLS